MSDPALSLAPLPAFLSEPALRAVIAALPTARLVGGAVRDALLGRPVADVDLAVPEPPDEVVRQLDAAGLKHAPTGLKHGTVTAISGGRGFEVTTLRTDARTDGRHAEVVWTPDWRADAARRDFTINAMSMRPDGAVFDYFGGLEDLKAGRLRFVGAPAQRIGEDYLRVLRYFRFLARYARLPPDPATLQALHNAVPQLGRLSAERVWSELKRILAAPDPVGAVRLMAELGVLQAILPGRSDPDALERLVQAGAPDDSLLRLMALDPAAPGRADALKLSKAEAATLAGLAGPPPDPAWDDDALRRALVSTPAAALLGRSWLSSGAAADAVAIRARVGAMPAPIFPLAGRDVVGLGVPAGPEVGGLLEAVQAWWMAGGCVADTAACRAELGRRVAGRPAGP